MNIEIGKSKFSSRSYSLEEVAIVPTKRTRSIEQVDISWDLEALKLQAPILGSPVDSVMSPKSISALNNVGGLGILNLEGLWGRHKNVDKLIDEFLNTEEEDKYDFLKSAYSREINEEYIRSVVAELVTSNNYVALSVSPGSVNKYKKLLKSLNVDLVVIQGTILSAEHVSEHEESLDIFEFVKFIDVPVLAGGVSSYNTAIHLMRSGIAGVLVGVGVGSASTVNETVGIKVSQATAISDAVAARSQYLEESGRYVNVIADGGFSNTGEICKALACGADAVMIGSLLSKASDGPFPGYHWGMKTFSSKVKRGKIIKHPKMYTLEQIFNHDNSTNSDGEVNIIGCIKQSMASTGYLNLKDFQKAELTIIS